MIIAVRVINTYLLFDPSTNIIYTISHTTLFRSAEAGIPFLGDVPFDRGLSLASDRGDPFVVTEPATPAEAAVEREDRKSTRLNSSHITISYAVICLKKKKTNITHMIFRVR